MGCGKDPTISRLVSVIAHRDILTTVSPGIFMRPLQKLYQVLFSWAFSCSSNRDFFYRSSEFLPKLPLGFGITPGCPSFSEFMSNFLLGLLHEILPDISQEISNKEFRRLSQQVFKKSPCKNAGKNFGSNYNRNSKRNSWCNSGNISKRSLKEIIGKTP